MGVASVAHLAHDSQIRHLFWAATVVSGISPDHGSLFESVLVRRVFGSSLGTARPQGIASSPGRINTVCASTSGRCSSARPSSSNRFENRPPLRVVNPPVNAMLIPRRSSFLFQSSRKHEPPSSWNRARQTVMLGNGRPTHVNARPAPPSRLGHPFHTCLKRTADPHAPALPGSQAPARPRLDLSSRSPVGFFGSHCWSVSRSRGWWDFPLDGNVILPHASSSRERCHGVPKRP